MTEQPEQPEQPARPDYRNKRTPAQRLADLTVIASWYVQGVPQHEMARRIAETRPYAISRAQIAVDIRAIQDEWRQHRLQSNDAWIAEQLMRLDEIEREAWKAWHDSRQPQRINIQNVRAGKDQKPEPTSGRIETHPGAGDVRYLQVVKDTVQERSKLLGLYPAAQANINIQGVIGMQAADVTRLDDEDLNAEIARLQAMTQIQRHVLSAVQEQTAPEQVIDVPPMDETPSA